MREPRLAPLMPKAGPVVAEVRIAAEPIVDGVSVPSAAADVLLGSTCSAPPARGATRSARDDEMD